MATAEVIALVGVLVAALSVAIGVALRATAALTAVRLEMVELRTELRAILNHPPQWCHEARRQCWQECPGREPTGVHAMPGHA